MDLQEDHQRMDAENGAIIVVENHGGQSGVPMIEEPTEAEHEGA